MVAEMLDLLAAHGEAAGVEEIDAELNKGNKEEQMERRHHMDADLRGDLAEAQGPGEQDHQEGGEADRGIDSDDDAEGQAPGEPPGRDAAAHEPQEGTEDFAAQELADGLGQEHTEMVRLAAPGEEGEVAWGSKGPVLSAGGGRRRGLRGLACHFWVIEE
jgi:hypothetical protein